jgi:hypothetical protein
MFGNFFLLHTSLHFVNFVLVLSGQDTLLFEESRVLLLRWTSPHQLLSIVLSFVSGRVALQSLMFCQALSFTYFRPSSLLLDDMRQVSPPAFLLDLSHMSVNGCSH